MLLVIETLRGDGEWTTNLGFTVMEVMGFSAAPVSVSLNGAAFGNFTWNSSTAVLDINVPHPVHGERQRWNIIGTTTSTKT
jgi:hypothetical protein